MQAAMDIAQKVNTTIIWKELKDFEIGMTIGDIVTYSNEYAY